jgi:phosphoglycerate dehydrogenase-like enzyme
LSEKPDATDVPRPSTTPNRPRVVVARVDRPPPGLPEVRSGAHYIFASNEDELRRALDEAEVMFVWNYANGKMFEDTFDAGRKLRWVHTAGVGVEPLLFRELVQSDVIVTNAGGVYEQTMAEYAVMLMLQIAKDAVHTLNDQRAHHWNRRRADTLQGRTVMIVGAGEIGRAIARLARALDMITIGVARSRRPGDSDFGVVHASSELPEIVGSADYVVLAAPLTPGTARLFDGDMLARMKPTAWLINLGRGGLIDESALLDSLRSNGIGGAALDVYWEEPLPPEHPLWDMPNVIVSPHMSGDVSDTHTRFVRSFLENLDRWQSGLPLRHVVDKSLGFRPSNPERQGGQ